MSLQRLQILDDRDLARTWSPFVESGAVRRLLFGTRSLEARLVHWSGLPLASPSEAHRSGAQLWLSPRFLPGTLSLPEELRRWKPLDGVHRLSLPDGTTIGWATPQGIDLASGQGGSDGWDRAPELCVAGELLHSPWTLLDRNASQIIQDLDHLLSAADAEAAGVRRLPSGALPKGAWVIGEAAVTVEPNVTVAPHVVLDASHGPIHLSRGVDIAPFTHLCGPAWIGPGARLLGGRLSAVTVGKASRIRGEVEASIIQGWTNKAHDGFLGHAVVGSWVNLGALTTNSDLKNTYGTVRVPLGPDVEEDTGMQKVGVLLGDHVKTGIGTLLTTGSVVGVGSNLLAGGTLAPRWVSPFSWVTSEATLPVRWEAFVTVARRSMARRSETLTIEEQDRLRALWVQTHGSRETPEP